MKHSLLAIAVTLTLVACVDKTGLSATSSKSAHPSTDANAIVTVTEYGDFQCPACRAAYTILDKPIIEKYGKKINFEFAQFPLTSLHEFAMEAAEASECASDQGKFWDFVDLDYTEQDKLNSAQLDVWGKQLGLNMDLFDRCRASHIKRDVINADYKAGTDLGVQGTPTFFVNGQKVESTLDALSKAIDADLGSAASKL